MTKCSKTLFKGKAKVVEQYRIVTKKKKLPRFLLGDMIDFHIMSRVLAG